MFEIHVKPSQSGGWDVIDAASGEASANYPRKRDAELGARELLRGHGGGEAIIYRLRGDIEERDSVPAAVRQ
jgi:hypothetical protein